MSVFAAGCCGAACVLAGSLAARYVIAREARLLLWAEAMDRAESALRQGGEELPRLLRLASAGGIPALSCLADRLEERPAAPWEELTRGLPGEPLLTPEEKAALLSCLPALFSPALDRQLSALQRLRPAWERFLRDAREKREKEGRLMKSLGWLAGAALFILVC